MWSGRTAEPAAVAQLLLPTLDGGLSRAQCGKVIDLLGWS
jgi:hypothetical protein